MSEVNFPTRTRLSELKIQPSMSRFSEFRQPSVESCSINEYYSGGDRGSEFPMLSQIKGSERHILEDDSEFESLPIDFSKLIFSTDASGKI